MGLLLNFPCHYFGVDHTGRGGTYQSELIWCNPERVTVAYWFHPPTPLICTISFAHIPTVQLPFRSIVDGFQTAGPAQIESLCYHGIEVEECICSQFMLPPLAPRDATTTAVGTAEPQMRPTHKKPSMLLFASYMAAVPPCDGSRCVLSRGAPLYFWSRSGIFGGFLPAPPPPTITRVTVMQEHLATKAALNSTPKPLNVVNGPYIFRRTCVGSV